MTPPRYSCEQRLLAKAVDTVAFIGRATETLCQLRKGEEAATGNDAGWRVGKGLALPPVYRKG